MFNITKITSNKWLLIALLVTYVLGYFAYGIFVKQKSYALYDSYLAANEFTTKKIKATIEYQNEEINRVLKLFTFTNKVLIKEVFRDPTNKLLIEKLNTRLKLFFGDFLTFTLINKSGEIVLEKHDGLVDKLCILEIKSFAQNKYQNLSFHRNPIAHHVDYLTELENNDGLFFISFYPEKIALLLKNVDQSEQEVLLMNKTRPYLVDFDIFTNRGNNNYKRFITPDDLNISLVILGVQNTNWNLLVKTKNKILESKVNEIKNNTRNIIILILFLLSIIYYVSNKQLFLRLGSEITLRKHYQNNYFESSMITVVINADTADIHETNQAAIDFYGYDKNDFSNKNYRDLLCDNKEKIDFDLTYLKALKVKYFTSKQLLKNGKTTQLDIHFSSFEENNTTYFLLLAHEVSDKIYYQKQLEKKTSLLESIALALPDMAFVINKNGVCSDVLDGDQFSKQQATEIIGVQITEIFDDDLSERALRIISRALHTKVTQYVEYQSDFIDNEMQWYEGRVVPITLDENYSDSVLWLARNIQDKKVKEQEINLAAMLFNTSDPVVIGNNDGEIIKVNPSFIKVLGYTEEQLLGQDITVFRSDKEKAKIVYENINQAVNATGDWSGVTLNICADGRELSMLETVTTIFDKNNQVDKIIAQFKDISEMLSLQLLVDESEARFKAIVETTNDIVILTNSNGISYVSPSTEKISGFNAEEIMHLDFMERVCEEHLERMKSYYSLCLQTENAKITIEPIQVMAKNNKKHWVKGTLSNLRHVAGVKGLVLSLENVTDIIEVEDAFKREVRKFKAIIEKGSDLVVVFNKNRLITYSSPSVEKCLGYKTENIIGMTSVELIHKEDLVSVKGNFAYLLAHPNGEVIMPDIRIKHKKGHYIVMEGVVTSIVDENSVDAIVFNARDVTDKRKDQKKIEHQAFYDELTDLPNRRFLVEYLTKFASVPQKNKFFGVVVFLDLDHFKYVNDSLGHDIGDKLLQLVALRIRPLIKDDGMFSRLGGDEFVIVLQELGSNEAEVITKSNKFCNKLLKVMEKKFVVNNHELYITPSMGLKLFSSNDDLNVNELLKHADSAMYHAKYLGRNQFVYYDKAIQEKSVHRLAIENDLREAVKLNQLVLHFQPQYSQSGEILSAEALIRWQHPKKGLLYPADFITVAEETGIIVEIGQWIIANALLNLQACLDKGIIDAKFVLSINISTVQFVRKGFTSNFITQVQAYPSLKNMLKVEVTETLLLDNLKIAKEKMLKLIEHGIQFSLDDFGTGYSSLQYLTRLPINQLKIDRSFVKNIGKHSRDDAIVKMIISMATYLNLSVVAEGIETKGQLDFFRDYEDVIIQGYYFSRPLDIVELIIELKK